MKSESWTAEGFIEWGKYLIAAIENDWGEDQEAAIKEFTEKYGRREFLYCEECEGSFDKVSSEDDFSSIDQTGHCLFCSMEFLAPPRQPLYVRYGHQLN